MAKLLKITVPVTAVALGAAIKLNQTSLQGGQYREAILEVPVLPATAVFKLQGHPQTADGAVPAGGSSEWTDLVTLNAASDTIQVIEDLPYYIRWNTTTLQATADVKVYLIGQQ